MPKRKLPQTPSTSKRPGYTKHTVKRLQMTLRSQEAYKLRIQGFSYKDIANRLGVASDATIYTDIQNHVVSERNASADRAHQRLEEDARYRALLQVWWPRAISKKPNLAALNGVLAILKRLDEIWGLDLGKQLERDGISDALLAVLHEVQARPLVSSPTEEPRQALNAVESLDAIWENMSRSGEVEPIEEPMDESISPESDAEESP